jgi:hypothetical protein
MSMTECSRKDLISFVNDWCIMHKTTIREFSVKLDISESGLSNFVSQLNGINQKIGDEIAKFFKVRYITTTSNASFERPPNPEETAAKKREQTKSDKEKNKLRVSIEDHHDERKRLNAEFGYNF